jgi:hypothetical protein
MSASFVPLIPGALPTSTPSMSPIRLKPVSLVPPVFEPTTPATLKAEAPAATAAPAPAPHVQHGPPKVTLEKQGDMITHIRIECSCGQITELKCEY